MEHTVLISRPLHVKWHIALMNFRHLTFVIQLDISQTFNKCMWRHLTFFVWTSLFLFSFFSLFPMFSFSLFSVITFNFLLCCSLWLGFELPPFGPLRLMHTLYPLSYLELPDVIAWIVVVINFLSNLVIWHLPDINLDILRTLKTCPSP